MARVIRLKEQQHNRNRPARPSEQALKRSDGSIADCEYPLNTDENGFILTGASVLENRKNIFCIGGSFVESSFAQPSERFVARAANSLDANVFNAGYSGTTLLQACVMLMTKLPTIAAKGDMVVLFSSQSDANASRLKGGYWNNNSTYTAIKPKSEAIPRWENSFDDTRALLETIATFCAGMGLELAIVVSPFRYLNWQSDKWARLNFGNKRVMGEFRQARDMLSNTFRETAQARQIPMLDMEAALQGNPTLFYDELHFNARGQEIGAELLTKFLSDDLGVAELI